MADFNFYLNRQGIQGRKGDKGDTGFTPTISVSEQTLNSYKLKITNEYNEFETPNLIGNLGVTDNGGTYLRYDPATGTVSTGEIDGATTEVVGGVRKATDDDLTNLSADSVVTPANVADMMPLVLEAGSDNVTIAQDDETSKTIITVTSETQDLTQLKAEVVTNSADIEVLKERTDAVEENITDLQTNKQNKLVAGNGITIDTDTNTISSTGGVGDVSAAGDNTFTGTNTFTDDVSMVKLEVQTALNAESGTIDNLQVPYTLTNTGKISAIEIEATGIHDGNSKKYLNETDLDGQTISMVDGKVHVNMDELGNEVNDLSGRVTANEADITTLQTDVTDINGDLDKKQTKLTAGSNITLTDLTDGTVKIDASGETSVPIATTSSTGIVKPDGTTITIAEDGTISTTGSSEVPIASATTLGGIKVGDNLSITEDGTLSATGGGDTSESLSGHGTVSFDNVSQNWNGYYARNDWYDHNSRLVASLRFSPQGVTTNTMHIDSSLGIGENRNSYGNYSGGLQLSNPDINDIKGQIRAGDSGNDKLFISGGAGYGLVLNPRLATYSKNVPAIAFRTDSSTDDYGALYTTKNVSAGDGININITNGDNIEISSTATAPSVATTSSTGVVKPDGTTITIAEDGTISAVGGGSTSDNMVTTDTVQSITAHKTFQGEIRVGDDSTYNTLAKFSKEELQFDDSTILEHIELGSYITVVNGTLGKKVYDTDKYIFKKYINIDDLSDNTIQYNNSISSQVAHMAMPSNKYIDLTLGASGTTYTAPADGWVSAYDFVCQSNTLLAIYQITNRGIGSRLARPYTRSYAEVFIPCAKGDTFKVEYGDQTGNINTPTLRFYYAVGSEPTV